ncbi:MAG: ATP-binding protein [Proteobacteria bacterium]|nr:ATP-binding protein [Pseudomonadota bacterium]
MGWRQVAVLVAVGLPAATLGLAAAGVLALAPAGLETPVPGRLATAAIAAAVALGMALLVLRRSSSPAALPLLLTFSALSVLIAERLLGDWIPALRTPGIAASCGLPAALGHLALTFPRERDIVRAYPRLLGFFYGGSAVLTAMALADAQRVPAVTEMALRSSEILCVASWIALVSSCGLAVRESRSALERARARVALWGALVVSAVSVGFAAVAVQGGRSAFDAALLGGALLPVPVGYAISRYQLFDVGTDVRRAAAQITSVAVSGLGVGAVAVLASRIVPGLDPGLLFAVAFTGAALAAVLRGPLQRGLRQWIRPESEGLRRLANEHARQLVDTSDSDLLAQRLCRFLRRGIRSVGVSVLLPYHRGWRLGFAEGGVASLDARAAERAARSLANRDLLHLAEEEAHAGEDPVALRAAGVELVAALRSDDRVLGIVLIGGASDRLPYSSEERGFARALCAQSALALHRAELVRELVEAEAFAAVGRVGASLVHDLGKPLGVLERVARALPRHLEDRDRAARDAETIADLAEEVRHTLRSILDDKPDPARSARSTPVFLDRALERVVRSVARLHGRDRIFVRRPPVMPRPSGDEDALVRALVNVLENALLASDGDELVEIAVALDGDRVILDVVDRGCGMSAACLRRAFEPFYSDRPARGDGLGLAISRELVEGMGGTIELSSAPGVGTRVRIALVAGADERAA